MKNFTILFAAAILFVTGLNAQLQKSSNNGNTKPFAENENKVRCGVDEMIQQRLQTDPVFRAKYEEGLRQYEASLNGTSRSDWTSTLTSPVTIPIVVHIVLPDPTIVTDQDVLYFINRLNLDYSGFNPDSANAATGYPVGNNFMPLRGHSLIRWALAKRTPTGGSTTGIERRASNVQIQGGNPQPIKSTAQGGLDAWDVTQYYNLWVGIGSGGLLGIAPEIGPGGPAGSTNTDGVCVDYRAFSRNPAYTLNAFCGGRTAVHEIGHNFGLYHTFQSGCSTTKDFGQMTSTTSGCPSGLPSNLLGPADDTPAQSGSTSGCPSGPTAAGCAQSPNPPGKMYQNYMDYTDDPCYSMFTKGQVDRMHYVLEFCRSGYLTSLGAVPPAGSITTDVAVVEVVRPGGSEIVGTGQYINAGNPAVNNVSQCSGWSVNTYPNPSCAGTISPRVRIKNLGTGNLAPGTNVQVFWSLNGTTLGNQTVNLPGGLISLQDTVVTVGNITLVTNNTLKFWTVLAGDQNTANDTVTKVLNFSGAPLPLNEGFESTTFPPDGWTIVQTPTNSNTWYRASAGSGSSASAGIDNYNFNAIGAADDIVSGPISVAGLDSLIISWDLAHKNYPGLNDEFQVRVSTNCGSSYTTVLSLTDPTTYPTAGSSTADYKTPGPNDWARKRVSIGNNVPGWGGQVLVAFRNINGYSNRAYIDNINIVGFAITPRDLAPQAIISPQNFECNQPIIPSMTVKNTGSGNISGFQVGYIIDNGTPTLCPTIYPALNAGATTTVTYTGCGLPVLAPGVHTIKMYTVPQGGPDTWPTNDTLSKTFTVRSVFNTVSENFDDPWPPDSVTIINPNANFTWKEDIPGRASRAGAEIDNYNNNGRGQTDDLQLLPLNTKNPAGTAFADSVILTFDVAHKNYPDPAYNDILSVVASNNCGNSFSATSYNKPGSVLATAGSSTAAYSTAGPNDWRTERVALGGSFTTTGSLILAIRNTNGYGNFIHIDNINATQKFKRDLKVVSINNPRPIICTGTQGPSVTIQNIGSDAVTSYNVVWQVDNGPVNTSTFNSAPNAPIAPNQSLIITLPNATFTPGPHTFTVYTASPVSLSGSGDLNTTNDTLRMTVTLVGSINPPVVEGFENTTFPPTGWGIVNTDNGITWQRTTDAASSGIASAYINNFNYANKGARDELWTPQITYTGVDSVSLRFDVAAITFNYPGSTQIPLDTLEVLVTKDCGNTYTSVYKKWGNELQTVNDPNNPQPFNFFPTNKGQWRTEYLELTGVAAGNGPLQVLFRNTNNKQNNIFLDNINIKTRTLPARLKAEGVMVLPSPFKDRFTVWHYQTPTNLRFITVYNSAGQLVWRQDYSGDALKEVTVDLRNRAAGVYIVHMAYSDSNRNTSFRIVKY